MAGLDLILPAYTPPAVAARWRSGRYYDTSHAMPLAAVATGALAASTEYAQPIYIPHDITVDRIAVRISSGAAAGKLLRLGLRQLNAANNGPGDLIVDGGTIAADSTGHLTVTISQALPGGRWIYAVANGDGTPTVNTWGAAPAASLDGFADLSNVPGLLYTASSAYGALPTTAPSSPTVTTGGIRIAIRVA